MYLSNRRLRRSGARRSLALVLSRRADEARRIMNDDVADGVLLDVRGIDIKNLLLNGERTSLSLALERLLYAGMESNYNSFHSSI
jgi:hypothetical protein